ncbi:hypothetical protein ACODT3_25500 [Streptomyces sp. 4.24]|uniref:hypothetical protein n=1 Tax=Streptomyces tritrimontium TaxID=3406573 RepID=UPI003BB4B2C1
MTLAAARMADLRKEPVNVVLDRVEQGLGVRLDRAMVIRKRRSEPVNVIKAGSAVYRCAGIV